MTEYYIGGLIATGAVLCILLLRYFAEEVYTWKRKVDDSIWEVDSEHTGNMALYKHIVKKADKDALHALVQRVEALENKED